MGFLRKHWALLMLLLLLGGVFLAVNKPPSVESASPSPSVFLASPSPSIAASPFVQEIEVAQEHGENAPIVLTQELESSAVETTVLENPGTRQADFFLLKVFPNGFSEGEFENADALKTERLTERVVRFTYRLASGGKTELRAAGGKWGSSLVYPVGLFSDEQERRLADLLDGFARSSLSTEELQAFQKIANEILNNDSLSSEEKLSQLEALVDAVKRISEKGAVAGAPGSARANAIEKAGALLLDGGVPALQNGIDEIIDEMSDTRACERLPRKIELNVSQCRLFTDDAASEKYGKPFSAKLEPNEAFENETQCNPSAIELNLAADAGFDAGSLVSRISPNLAQLLEFLVFRSDEVLNASVFAKQGYWNGLPKPWVSQTEDSPAGVIYSGVSRSSKIMQLEIDPRSLSDNTLLGSLLSSGSLQLNNQTHAKCLNEYREQGETYLVYRDKVLGNVSISVQPLKVAFNRGVAFSCQENACSMPNDACVLRSESITFNYSLETAGQTALIRSTGSTQVEQSIYLTRKAGGFVFVPPIAGNYELTIGSSKIYFSVRNRFEDCFPNYRLNPVSAECVGYLSKDGKLKVDVVLFEFANATKCESGTLTGIFGRVVNLPCTTRVEVCTHFYTLGKAMNPVSTDSPLWPLRACEYTKESIEKMSLSEFRSNLIPISYCVTRNCKGGFSNQPCSNCFESVGISGEKQKMIMDYMTDHYVFGPTTEHGVLASGISEQGGYAVTTNAHGLIFDSSEDLCTFLSKPALYLYPEKPLNGRVSLETNEFVVVSDPLISQNNDWTYYALPDSRVFVDGVEYPYLFYETTLLQPLERGKSGWVVERQKVEKWFFDMLPKMGLNARETKDFADYWVTRLPDAEFYEIKLIPKENIDRVVRVVFDPRPDVFIRVILSIKPTDSPALLEPPVLQTPVREGFVAAEWGVILEV